MRSCVTSYCLMLIVLLSLSVMASDKPEITYQGQLRDSTGAVNSTLAMTFRVFLTATGGAHLWEESHSDVVVTNGYFSVHLGGVTGGFDTLFTNHANDSLWLEVQVGDEVMGSRARMASVPYSIRSNAGAGDYSVVGGGYQNDAQGEYGTISGGRSNVITDVGYRYSTISGGQGNQINQDYAVVGGGHTNNASGVGSTIPGGENNSAAGDYSLAAGRRAKADHQGTFVWGDATDADFTSTGSDQFLIRASGGVGIGTANPNFPLDVAGVIRSSSGGFRFPDGTVQMTAATGGGDIDGVATSGGLGGGGTSGTVDVYIADGGVTTAKLDATNTGTTGQVLTKSATSGRFTWADDQTGSGGDDGDWTISGSDIYSTVSGNVGIGETSPSEKLHVNGNLKATGKATIGSGHTNSGSYGFVAGQNNTVSGGHAVVGGGYQNDAQGEYGTISGGHSNTITDVGYRYSAISGGRSNQVDADYAAIGGGQSNAVSAGHGTVPGGLSNEANGYYSFAAGRRAKAEHQGAFVWGDATDVDFSSTAADQFLIRASGGVGIGTASPSEDLQVVGTAEVDGFKMDEGASAGYVLTSDGSGNGTWQSATSAQSTLEVARLIEELMAKNAELEQRIAQLETQLETKR